MKTFAAAVVALCCITGSSATLINLINQCPYGVTAFARSGSSATNSYNLGASGGSQQLDVGSSFPAGLIFASTTGSENNAQVKLAGRSPPGPVVQRSLASGPQLRPASSPLARLLCFSGCRPGLPSKLRISDQRFTFLLQATQLEITAGANGRDTYDISLVVRLDFLSSTGSCCSARASARRYCDLLQQSLTFSDSADCFHVKHFPRVVRSAPASHGCTSIPQVDLSPCQADCAPCRQEPDSQRL